SSGSLFEPFKPIQSSSSPIPARTFLSILMDMFLDASKSAGMMLQQPPQQQQARSYVATSSFYTDNFSAPPGYNVARLCLTRQRRYQLLRLGFAMLSLVLLCGAAVGCVWLVSGRVGSWPDYLTQSSRRNHNQLKSALGDEAEEADLDRPSEDGRKYFASNLSTLMAGGWPPEARFHLLNDTVYCDAPAAEDSRLVYAEPTWMCKNI
uniref:SLC3A2_N domain-containing protein n=2 Tax=Macrostomum lignano TaxID=282301 RepID=A0A1I8I8J3_9PLAT